MDFPDENPLRPRQYARDIARLATVDERRAALLDVPEPWQGLVRRHVEIAYERAQARKGR